MKNKEVESLENRLRKNNLELQYYKGYYEGVNKIAKILSKDEGSIKIHCFANEMERRLKNGSK